ncbi:MAG: peptide-methionine (R)-S-oxide reductase MsrB [Proteobacteria bacterium]|nr:peptide-methionine (R)-S-oxide reductase MsrB [Pseudomonadota bacterium]MDA1331925.1 peptide-methionine (R)-S-oxide reductase MsrB [Pseudomonadota bacterium]
MRKLSKTDEQWRADLAPEEYQILRKEGTERSFSHPLNQEQRKGTFVCIGCETPLFTSDMKFDSGTGWPSFFTHIHDAFITKVDKKLFMPRTEYRCATCDGHHGHVFPDGPQPSGLRYCNNGTALKFIPDE